MLLSIRDALESVEIPRFSAQGLLLSLSALLGLVWLLSHACQNWAGAWSRVLERHEDVDSLPHPCFPRGHSPARPLADLAECG